MQASLCDCIYPPDDFVAERLTSTKGGDQQKEGKGDVVDDRMDGGGDDRLERSSKTMLLSAVPKSLSGLYRQCEVEAPSSLITSLAVTNKRGEQQMGERGKDVALCLLDGMDGGW